MNETEKEPLTLQTFAAAVRRMMDAQALYFDPKHRTRENLILAKRMEARVRELLAEIEAGKKSLNSQIELWNEPE